MCLTSGRLPLSPPLPSLPQVQQSAGNMKGKVLQALINATTQIKYNYIFNSLL